MMKWTPEAENAIKKVPFFVRKRVKKRVEDEARKAGADAVCLDDRNDLGPLLPRQINPGRIVAILTGVVRGAHAGNRQQKREKHDCARARVCAAQGELPL